MYPPPRYLVKVIATDPYAGRFEHVVEIYIAPTILRLFSMLWQFLTIFGGAISAVWVAYHGRALFFNTFRKNKYTCVPRFLEVRKSWTDAPDLEEFHLCKPDWQIVSEILVAVKWRDYFGASPETPGAELEVEKLKEEVLHWIRTNLKGRQKIPEQAQLRWKGKKNRTHVAISMAAQRVVAPEQVEQPAVSEEQPAVSAVAEDSSQPQPARPVGGAAKKLLFAHGNRLRRSFRPFSE